MIQPHSQNPTVKLYKTLTLSVYFFMELKCLKIYKLLEIPKPSCKGLAYSVELSKTLFTLFFFYFFYLSQLVLSSISTSNRCRGRTRTHESLIYADLNSTNVKSIIHSTLYLDTCKAWAKPLKVALAADSKRLSSVHSPWLFKSCLVIIQHHLLTVFQSFLYKPKVSYIS